MAVRPRLSSTERLASLVPLTLFLSYLLPTSFHSPSWIHHQAAWAEATSPAFSVATVADSVTVEVSASLVASIPTAATSVSIQTKKSEVESDDDAYAGSSLSYYTHSSENGLGENKGMRR